MTTPNDIPDAPAPLPHCVHRGEARGQRMFGPVTQDVWCCWCGVFATVTLVVGATDDGAHGRYQPNRLSDAIPVSWAGVPCTVRTQHAKQSATTTSSTDRSAA